MRLPTLLRMRRHAARALRRGVSVVEIMVAITTLGVALSLIGRASMAVNQYNRLNDLRTKRNLAMQQQLNFISALPFTSITTSILPSSKSFVTGDFSYSRRVTLTPGTNSVNIVVTIVPQTGTAKDTLQKESATITRNVPACGTVLNVC